MAVATSQQAKRDQDFIDAASGSAGAVGISRKRIDLAALRAVTNAMPMQQESASDFVRRMRDEDRY